LNLSVSNDFYCQKIFRMLITHVIRILFMKIYFSGKDSLELSNVIIIIIACSVISFICFVSFQGIAFAQNTSKQVNSNSTTTSMVGNQKGNKLPNILIL
jgi:hypothetical protein